MRLLEEHPHRNQQSNSQESHSRSIVKLLAITLALLLLATVSVQTTSADSSTLNWDTPQVGKVVAHGTLTSTNGQIGCFFGGVRGITTVPLGVSRNVTLYVDDNCLCP